MSVYLRFLAPEERLCWLRDRLGEPLPSGFQWRYVDFDRCALGLYAWHLDVPASEVSRKDFGLSGAAYLNIFYFAGGLRFGLVSPDDVRARIDQHLKRRARNGFLAECGALCQLLFFWLWMFLLIPIGLAVLVGKLADSVTEWLMRSLSQKMRIGVASPTLQKV